MSNFVRPAAEGADPFGTARLRRGVLDAWATSPARFREDANAEEDLVLGGYRDRLVVELAQNAADAAARAGVPGRLRLTLRDGVLVAANTGAALDAAGVESLSTLRASAKRDTPSVGRFGVGFAAVLAVTDEPAVVGRHGGVRWSLAEARDLAAGIARHSPGLGDEIRRRDGHVPVLRLPYAAEGTAPAPYDTAVILPLRDSAAADLAERLLDAVDDSLLLTLPGLEEVVIEVGEGEPRTLRRRAGSVGAGGSAGASGGGSAGALTLTVVEDSRDGTTAWRTLSAHGATDPELLTDRPVEERLRPHWSLTWAVPVDPQGEPVRARTAPVLHAPTPSDDPLGVPALLIASFPLDTTRRRTAPGPLTDFLVQRAADAYTELLAAWRPVTTAIIDLVPGPLGKGELDGALRAAILERLPRTAFLPPAVAETGVGETAGPVFGTAAGIGGVSGEAVNGVSGGTAGLASGGTAGPAFGAAEGLYAAPGDSANSGALGSGSAPGGSGSLGSGPANSGFLGSGSAPGGSGSLGSGSAPGGSANSGSSGFGSAPVGSASPGSDTAPADLLHLPDDPSTTPEAFPHPLRPRDAEVVEGAGSDTVRVLAEVLPTLLPAGLERRSELRTLGVARLPLADVIDRLAGLEKAPDWWYRLYDSLAGVDPDRLSGLPVPLGDGRTAIGPRQVLLPLPDTTTDPEVLARLGLKVAHEDAAHPLLEKLGALPASPRAILTTPQVRNAVAASLDDDSGAWDEDAPDAEELAETVLALVKEAGLEPGDEPWLGALALPDEDGELSPAGELVLPDSPFANVIREDELAEVDAELAQKWGEQPLTACGVLASFALVRATDVVLDPDELEPREGDFAEPDDAGLLDAVDVWAEDILDRFPDSPVPPVATELLAVRDLDLVDEDKWPEALALLAQPPLRDALIQPLRVLLPDGTHEIVRPYTAWWLRGHPVLDGRRPAGLLATGGDPLLRGLYDEADATGFDDEQVLRALGVRTSVSALLEEPGGAAELLDRLADPDREVTAAQLHGLYSALADLDPEQVTLPEELRAVVDGVVEVVDAADAVVVDSPDLLPFTGGVPLLPVRPARAAELAELFQVRRLSESVTGEVDSEGAEHDVPDSVAVLLGPLTPNSYVEHDELIVDGVEIDWRLTDDGVLHAATLEGVAAGLAWAAGQWPRRFEVAALLEDPSRTGELARDRWFD